MMAELLTTVVSLPTLLLVFVVFGFAPGFCLRLIVLAYPRSDPRRTELIAELYVVPRIERPLWVAEQLEVALFEGLRRRSVPAIGIVGVIAMVLAGALAIGIVGVIAIVLVGGLAIGFEGVLEGGLVHVFAAVLAGILATGLSVLLAILLAGGLIKGVLARMRQRATHRLRERGQREG